MTAEKLVAQVTVRLDEATVNAIDAYIERRVREARLPLSRAQAIRELLDRVIIDGRVQAEAAPAPLRRARA